MALDIVTATGKPRTPKATQAAASPSEIDSVRQRPRLSPLTRRILAVNILALGLLAVGLLQLGDYQQSLIESQLAALKTQGQVFAAALGEGAVSESPGEGETLLPDLGRQMVRRLVEPTRLRARVYGTDGKLFSDTHAAGGYGNELEIQDLPPPDQAGLLSRTATGIYDFIMRLLPGSYPSVPFQESPQNYPEVKLALTGDIADAVRRKRDGGLVLSVAVPVQHYRQVLGALLLSSESGDIEQTVRAVRFGILKTFGIAFVFTVLLSMYLAGTIARPIRRLAEAARQIRQGQGRQVEIPALTKRDEIGDLARAFRDMTDALWQRMDAIERFAADVAHEVKNPLTSVRSAIETASRISDPEKRQKLLLLVLDDIERLTRLITEISDASRVDAELSRVEMAPMLLGRMLAALVEVHEAVARPGEPQLVLSLPGKIGTNAGDLPVLANEDRLVQVFRNLIANALSFSPGIPDGKLEAIFDRFYSERPAGEKFGTHSGLGLSISKQIIETHRGSIKAENRHDASGAIVGAKFTVRIPALQASDPTRR